MLHFGKEKVKDKEVDYTSLNQILHTSKKIINIGYFMAIICIVLLITYIVKEWKIFTYLQELLVVISPIFIGILIAWLFEPLVKKMENKKIPRIICCIFVYLLIIGIFFLGTYLFIPSLISQVKDFVRAAPTIFESLTDFIVGIVSKMDPNHMVEVSQLKKEITSSVTDWGMQFGSELPKHLFMIGKSIFSGGLNVVLGLMIGFYLLFDFERFTLFVETIIPHDWKDGYKVLSHRINTSLRGYVQGVLIVMLLVFLTQCVGLTIAGLEAPILFALFCALTDIIPYFGPYIGAIPAIIVGFTISPITGICVCISIIVVQLLENNFYQPLIMGHTMKLHPVTIMVGLLVFQHFFGILGMVIATPCIACIKVILVFIFERFQPLSNFIETTTEDK